MNLEKENNNDDSTPDSTRDSSNGNKSERDSSSLDTAPANSQEDYLSEEENHQDIWGRLLPMHRSMKQIGKRIA